MEFESQKAMSAVDKLLKVKETDEISDLHTVREEEEDAELLSSKTEARSYLEAEVLEDVLMQEVRQISRSMLKVNNFLLACVYRRRFQRKQLSI